MTSSVCMMECGLRHRTFNTRSMGPVPSTSAGSCRTAQRIPTAPARAPSACSLATQHLSAKQDVLHSLRAKGLKGFRLSESRGAAKNNCSSQRLQINCMDAAQPFDYEAKAKAQLSKKEVHWANDPKLSIGIVGFGNFGQFIATRFMKQGHKVLAFSRSDYTKEAAALGAEYFDQIDDFCEEHPDVVILCTSILSTEKVLTSIPFQRLRRSTLFVDVLSVKSFPKALMLKFLPDSCDILCTHPMFGPESGKESWEGLTFQYEKVRVNSGLVNSRANMTGEDRADAFIKIWNNESCKMVEMTCEEHDRLAAGSQFITHTVGRVLGKLDLESTPIDTKGYKSLLDLKGNTEKDSFDLYYGLFMYNQNATDELDRLEKAFDDVKKQLFGRLHQLVRAEIFHGTADPVTMKARPTAPLSPVAGADDKSLAEPNSNPGASMNGIGIETTKK